MISEAIISEEKNVGGIPLCKTGSYPLNSRNVANGLDLLADINDGKIAAVFFDPQYRGVLDKMHYGNEGVGRGQGRCSLDQMDEKTIKRFLQEIDRVLKMGGYLFLWVDKFHLGEGIKPWLEGTHFELKDIIVWDKGRIGMGRRARCKCEYLVILQKCNSRTTANWTDHSIPDVWMEVVKKNHPHSKPVDLQKRLIAATTQEGDIVLDPASGGYSVFMACQAAGRDFLGCDIRFGEDQYGKSYEQVSLNFS